MTKLVKMSAIIFLVCLIGGNTIGAPFEQLFRIMQISGECEVMPAGASAFITAEEGKAYAYGSTVKTGRKSSALIQLSEGNTCRVLAKAELSVSDGAMDPKLKTIKLSEGKIEVSLEKNLKEQFGNSLNVETATAVCGAIGTVFSAEAAREQDINVVVFIISEGSTTIGGMNFNIGSAAAGVGLSISGDDSGSFTRIKCLKGAFDIEYKDSQGQPKIVSTQANSIIKIWRRRAKAGNLIIITVIVTEPDGTTLPADVFTDEIDEEQANKLDQQDQPPSNKRVIKIGEDGLITITTTTSTTTTTTQPKSITPIGRGRS